MSAQNPFEHTVPLPTKTFRDNTEKPNLIFRQNSVISAIVTTGIVETLYFET